MPIALSQSELHEIRAIIGTVPLVEKAVLFGSRATGNARKYSDVDIMLYGDEPVLRAIGRARSLLEASRVPYQFDVLHHSRVRSKDLLDHVERFGKVIYERDKSSPLEEARNQGRLEGEIAERERWREVVMAQKMKLVRQTEEIEKLKAHIKSLGMEAASM